MDNKVIAGASILAIAVGGGLYYLINKKGTTGGDTGGTTGGGTNTQEYSVIVTAPDNTQKAFILSFTDFNKLGGLGVSTGSISTVTGQILNSYDDVLNWLFLHQKTTSTSPPSTGGGTTPPVTGGQAGGQPPNTEPTGVQIQNLIISPISGRAPLGCSFQLQGVTVSSTILWDFGDGTKISGGLVQSHTYFSAGTYNGNVHVTGPDGFSTDFRNFAIVVIPKISNSFINLDQISPTVQQNQSGGFSIGLGKPWSSITWDWGDGSAKTLNTTNPSHTFNIVGVFTGNVTVVATDGSTDTKSFITTVTVNPLTTITLNIRAGPASATSIFGSNVQFFLNELIEFEAEIGGGISPFTTSWSVNDGNATGTGVFFNHAFTKTGTYTVTCTVSDSRGTIQKATLAVTIEALPIEATDVIAVTHSSANYGGYFQGDGALPLETIVYVGGAKNTRNDIAIQIICTIEITRFNNVVSTVKQNLTIPASTTLYFHLFIGQVTSDGNTKCNIIYDSVVPLQGTQIHLDEVSGVVV